MGGVRSENTGWNWRPHSLQLSLAPLAVHFLRHVKNPQASRSQEV
jgi:hypothetical protein